MKTFCHVPIELEDLKTQTIDKKRFYETPDGNRRNESWSS